MIDKLYQTVFECFQPRKRALDSTQGRKKYSLINIWSADVNCSNILSISYKYLMTYCFTQNESINSLSVDIIDNNVSMYYTCRNICVLQRFHIYAGMIIYNVLMKPLWKDCDVTNNIKSKIDTVFLSLLYHWPIAN